MAAVDREADIAQARVFVTALNGHVDRCSATIEDVERQFLALRKQGKLSTAQTRAAEAIALREELYDIHRQLDRLHDSFPELRARPDRSPPP